MLVSLERQNNNRKYTDYCYPRPPALVPPLPCHGVFSYHCYVNNTGVPKKRRTMTNCEARLRSAHRNFG